MTHYYGGIEAGGTKFVCAVGTGPDDIRAEIRFPTTTPDETIGRATTFFRQQAKEVELAAIGIGSFGPVDPNPASPTFGFITTTPKHGWQDVDFAGAVDRCQCSRPGRTSLGCSAGSGHIHLSHGWHRYRWWGHDRR